MKATVISSSDLENRFEPRYYDPKALNLIRRITEKSKSEGFEIRELQSFGPLKKGIFDIKSTEYRSSGIPFIRVSCIKYLTVDVNDITYIGEDWHVKGENTEMSPGDIAISKSGTVGHVAIVPQWLGVSNISQDIIGLFVKEKKYSGFLAAYLSSNLGKTQMEKVKTQQTHAHLALPPIRKLKILFNEDIALQVSNLINNAVSLEKEFFDNYEKAKTELLAYLDICADERKYQTFLVSSRDINSKFFPTFYYPSYLAIVKSIQEKFDTVKLDDISEIKNGIEIGSKNYQATGVPFIRTSDFVNYGIDRDSYHKIDEELYNQYQQDVKPNDILFTNDGKIGLTGMVVDNDTCIIQSHIKRVRITDETFTPEFIFVYLTTKIGLYQIYRRIFIQSTIPTIENGLHDVLIPIVDESIIKKVTHYCRSAFEAKEKRNALVEEARILVESMIV